MMRIISYLLSVLLSILLVAACDSAVTPDGSTTTGLSADPSQPGLQGMSTDALSKREKSKICHVGNELPEYDPDCTEDCGDAGKIDLISVPNVAKHLDNPSHCYDGTCDFVPDNPNVPNADIDTDGNFVDEACETDTCLLSLNPPCATEGTVSTNYWAQFDTPTELIDQVQLCGLSELSSACTAACGSDHTVVSIYDPIPDTYFLACWTG